MVGLPSKRLVPPCDQFPRRGGTSLKEMLSSSGNSDGFWVVMGIGVRILNGQRASGTLE